MESPIFPDKSHPPDDADVAAVLGRAKVHWDRLTEDARAAAPGATPEWKYYTKKSGWVFLLRGKQRNVLYMRPTGKGRFLVSFVFGEKAVRAAEESDLPAGTIEAIRTAPKYPEGRPAVVTVKAAADLKTARTLLAIKLAN